MNERSNILLKFSQARKKPLQVTMTATIMHYLCVPMPAGIRPSLTEWIHFPLSQSFVFCVACLASLCFGYHL